MKAKTKIKAKKKPIFNSRLLPHDVIIEFINNVEFRGSPEGSLYVAEQIGAGSYLNMNQLVATCRNYAKNQIRFNEFVQECRTHPFYKKYFKI